jgi:hypothetical protein
MRNPPSRAFVEAGWTWVVPVSICVGTFFVFLNLLSARRTGGLNLPVLAWPAAFVSLGWNFILTNHEKGI